MALAQKIDDVIAPVTTRTIVSPDGKSKIRYEAAERALAAGDATTVAKFALLAIDPATSADVPAGKQRIEGTKRLEEIDGKAKEVFDYEDAPPLPEPPEPDPIFGVGYSPSSHEVVAEMLDIASVGKGDTVIDLGSGDGRIVIAAAKRGAAGVGIDIDPVRIAEAESNAASDGVSVDFIEADFLDVDLSAATVVTMYLGDAWTQKLALRLSIGVRIVSHGSPIPWLKPADMRIVSGEAIYLYEMP